MNGSYLSAAGAEAWPGVLCQLARNRVRSAGVIMSSIMVLCFSIQTRSWFCKPCDISSVNWTPVRAQLGHREPAARHRESLRAPGCVLRRAATNHFPLPILRSAASSRSRRLQHQYSITALVKKKRDNNARQALFQWLAPPFLFKALCQAWLVAAVHADYPDAEHPIRSWFSSKAGSGVQAARNWPVQTEAN